MSAYRMELLSPSHDRKDFDCGVPALNEYLSRQAGQDMRRRISACFLAIEAASAEVSGYYTLSAGSVMLTELPESTARKLPRYPAVPVARIGRLAVGRRHQGKKLGAALLFDALQRSIRSEIAVFAVIVDAKDDSAVQFYEQFGFQSLSASPRTLFLPLGAALRKLANS